MAASVAHIWYVMLVGAVLLFALVAGLLALAFLRPGAGRNARPSLWVVGGGLILPAAVLTPLLIYGLLAGERLFAKHAMPIEVGVSARQWEWHFTYRVEDGTVRHSVDVLHVPADQIVLLKITSSDVIHSFWIPRLAGKIDAIPGHVTELRLTANIPGSYRGLCSEFCGTGHVAMQMTLQAHDSMEAFTAAVNGLPKADGQSRKSGEAR